ncbi:recombinase family protein [Thalassobius sp. Cn5-15]|uniref:recombinase family protein n=1 Tax=Thalassobius sp. Cn5-15 TaxID=2917763 RepID=UPI001EF39DFC|nr:recombinase family protein [Thalassobius sp. Cn5-15]MCG7492494.1 recombinase family protein [Thalassobius sp. Cn5-15]
MEDVDFEGDTKGRRIGYVRVSDKDQSQDLQVDALKHAGCDVIYGDLGMSGADVTRRSLETLLRDLTKGDTLVVWKLDRLSRSTLHLLELLDDLRVNGVDFIALTQGIDTTTAVGRMVFGHLAVFAEFEREQIRERTKAGMAAAKARGVHIGRPRAISDDMARLIKHRLAIGEASVSQLAEELDISQQTIVRAMKNIE